MTNIMDRTEDEHIFEVNGEFFFWDETGAHAHGPYGSLDDARQAIRKYVEALG